MAPAPVPLNCFGLATAGVIAIEAAARWAGARWPFPPLEVIGAARLLGIAWLLLIIQRWGPGLTHSGLSRAGWGPGLRRGLLWSAAFGAAAAAGFGAASLAGLDPLRLLLPGPAAGGRPPAMLFLVGGLLGPAAEEIYFRGILYGALRRWGRLTALAGSTLVFTFLHPGAAGIPLTQAIGGVVFAASYEIEKHLAVPITIHVLGNLAIFSLPYALHLLSRG
jgi:membrane protease YdiL (CAAX protease family)